jgi:NADP-dependent aldehyde dehydrogenase
MMLGRGVSTNHTMDLHGKNIIAGRLSAESGQTFTGVDPATGRALAPEFHAATAPEIAQAADWAGAAARAVRPHDSERTAGLLEGIADRIMALGDELLQRAQDETGLTRDRLSGERGRTVNQCRMFAGVVREGSWVQALVETAIPDRTPLPKPDLRQMLVPIGPVAVFGASNFPLAYSVAGGDTASALAAGNPVIVKAHPAHPGTSEMVGRAVTEAVRDAGFPAGWFSMVHGPAPADGLALVRHPQVKAVGFTGSLRGGRALFDAACARAEPIPVHAEMGSTNPIFVLPGAASERGEQIAQGLRTSVTTGAGQFCTKPGIVIVLRDPAGEAFVSRAAELIGATPPGTMLHSGILDAYAAGVKRLADGGVAAVGGSRTDADWARTQAAAAVFAVDAERLLAEPWLSEEVFGPAALVVWCASMDQMERVAEDLGGQLTASIHAASSDLAAAQRLLPILQRKAGRLIHNGFPTGVEVCAAMNHGGPYPASTDVRSTSVGALAIRRWVRPVCYQNAPQELLPVELRDANSRNILRLVNGEWRRGPA